MTEHDARLGAILRDALSGADHAEAAPVFQHVWARARSAAASPTQGLPATSRLWTVASVFALLLALGIGLRDLGRNHERELATGALMANLSANLHWHAPSDQLLSVGDTRVLFELPDIPLVDTSPKELNL